MVHDSTQYVWLVVKGSVVELLSFTGVECGSGRLVLGGVMGAGTASSMGVDCGSGGVTVTGTAFMASEEQKTHGLRINRALHY